MKRFITLLLVVLFSITTIGCSTKMEITLDNSKVSPNKDGVFIISGAYTGPKDAKMRIGENDIKDWLKEDGSFEIELQIHETDDIRTNVVVYKNDNEAFAELFIDNSAQRETETQKHTEQKTELPKSASGWSKEICEANAKEHPAGPGKVLVTKGDNKFTGYPYYFKGELKSIGSAEAFNGKTVWLIKNDKGYVMPVQMPDGEDGEIDSIVEIWGTLSGDGYSLPNVDNVVGEAGYMIMIQYSVDGEPKI